MAYDIKDIKQAALGAVVAILLFYLIRAGNPISIDPTKGLIVGVIWLYLASTPFINKRRQSKEHSIGNIIVALVVTAGLALTFEMVTWDVLTSFEFFGSAAWLGLLLAIPSAQFFDKMNISNMYERWFYKKR